MFSIWINGILRPLGILRILQIFLALLKVLLTYIWRWLANCSSSSFCGRRGLERIRMIFSNKCPCIFSTWPNWRKVVFFGIGRQEWRKVRLLQIALSFNEIKKVCPFVKFESSHHSFSVFWKPAQLSTV